MIVASIGTIEPANVAGVGRDLQVIAEHRLRAVCAVASISAQDETGVRALFALPDRMVAAQLDALPQANAYRVGALGSAQNIDTVTRFLGRQPGAWIVVDPVMEATRGGSLYDGAAAAVIALRELITGAPVIVTPNLQEAASLTGMPVHDVTTMEAAGRDLVARGARAALVKGGHLEGEPIDVLIAGSGVHRFGAGRIAGEMRGRGCTLAAALACELARGSDLQTAVARAREYVRQQIAAS